MPKKKGNSPVGPHTGNDFIQLAKERGALVEKSKKFTKIKTPKGSVHIAPGDTNLDPQTRLNLRRWFRLLGLMLFIVLCILPMVKSFL